MYGSVRRNICSRQLFTIVFPIQRGLQRRKSCCYDPKSFSIRLQKDAKRPAKAWEAFVVPKVANCFIQRLLLYCFLVSRTAPNLSTYHRNVMHVIRRYYMMLTDSYLKSILCLLSSLDNKISF